MPERLANLTLRFSQEISSLEALGARELEEAEKTRDAALGALPKVQAILSRFHEAVEKAREDRIEAVEKADSGRDREVDEAEEKRRGRLAREEQALREARRIAFDRKSEATRKARAKWQQAIEKARSEPLSEQRRIRRVADDALERGLEEIRDEYGRSMEASRLAYQGALQDHMVEERLAVEAAHRKAEKLIAAAAIAHQHAFAAEENRLRVELAAFPEATRVLSEHDRKVAEIRHSSEQAKEALFQRFRRDRRGMRRG
jgi:hypothetical protein